MNCSLISFALLFSAVIIQASEGPVISALTQEDIAQALPVLQDCFHTLVRLPEDQQQRLQKIKALSQHVEEALTKNVPVSNAQIIENTLRRVVIKEDGDIKGVADYFLRHSDGNGYIETLCTTQDCKHYNEILIQYAIDQMKQNNIPTILTHILETDEHNIELHKKLGFVPVDQTESEKAESMVLFRYVIKGGIISTLKGGHSTSSTKGGTSSTI